GREVELCAGAEYPAIQRVAVGGHRAQVLVRTFDLAVGVAALDIHLGAADAGSETPAHIDVAARFHADLVTQDKHVVDALAHTGVRQFGFETGEHARPEIDIDARSDAVEDAVIALADGAVAELDVVVTHHGADIDSGTALREGGGGGGRQKGGGGECK